MSEHARAILLLTLVSGLWAFSFGLIKTFLAGIDPVILACVRLTLAFLVLLPFLRPSRLHPADILTFVGLGGVQYGLMYILLFQAFRYLHAYEVVLFTLLTPLYIDLLDELRNRRFRPKSLTAVCLAVFGAGVIKFRAPESENWWIGFLVMQGANLCFGGGQLAYRLIRRKNRAIPDHQLFGWMFLGGALLAGALSLVSADWQTLTGIGPSQVVVILYLGTIASGLGFFLWNTAAVRVRTTTLLAVFNNLNVPLGVAVSLLVFGEQTDLPRLLAGGVLMALSIWLAGRVRSRDRRSP